jgi:HK97 family phage portal protein
MPENNLMSILQKYANDFLAGEDLPSTSYGSVDVDTALAYSAVFACNRVLSETLASCPIFLYQKDAKGNRKVLTNAREHDLLHNAPSDEMTPGAFKEFGMSSINLGGNMFAQKIRNTYGEIIQLRPISWDRVHIQIDKTTGAYEYHLDSKTQEPLSRRDILHIPGLSMNGYTGVTPIEYAQSALRVGLYQESFQQNFYKNGVMTSGIFEHPGALSSEAFERLKSDLTRNYVGMKNSGTPMILEEGMKFSPVTMKLSDAQFIESKRFQIEDIARMFRVPLHLIGDLTRSTNNNIEHQSLEFIIYTMLPHFKRWEENLNLQLLTPADRMAGKYFEFKIDALLRGDIVSRYTAYATARQWGWLSVNDVLRLENMNGIGPKGDIFLSPLNMGEAGKENLNEKENEKVAAQLRQIIERGETLE